LVEVENPVFQDVDANNGIPLPVQQPWQSPQPIQLSAVAPIPLFSPASAPPTSVEEISVRVTELEDEARVLSMYIIFTASSCEVHFARFLL
jgi:hypothetical protein